MDIKLNGKKVSGFIDSFGKLIEDTERLSYILSIENCGDRQEEWIVEMSGGRESACWNCRYVMAIALAPEDEKP